MPKDLNGIEEPEDDEMDGVELEPEEKADNEILSLFLNKEDEEEEESEDEEGDEEGDEEEKEEAEEKGDEEEEKEDEESEDEEEESEDDEEEEETNEDALDEGGTPLNKKDLLSAKIKLKVDKEVEEITVRKAISLAQRAKSSDAKYQEAAIQRKQAISIIKQQKKDPLGTFYELMAHEVGEDAAYEQLKKHCTNFLGKEMEFLALPEEEQVKRRSEAALARKDAEIGRLRQSKSQDARELRGQMLVQQIIAEVKETALPGDRGTLNMVAQIFDAREARGEKPNVKDCVKELVHLQEETFKRRLQSLSKDEIERLSSKNGDKRKSPGKALQRVRKRARSTPKAKRRKAKEPQNTNGYFSTHEEAYLAYLADEKG